MPCWTLKPVSHYSLCFSIPSSVHVYSVINNNSILSSFTRKSYALLMVLNCFCSQWWALMQNHSHCALFAILALHLKALTNSLVLSRSMTPARLQKGLACRVPFARTRHASSLWSLKVFVPVLSVVVPWFLIQWVHLNGGFTATCVTALYYSHMLPIGSTLQIKSAQHVSLLSSKLISTRKPPLFKMELHCMRVVSCVMICCIHSLKWNMGSRSLCGEVEVEGGGGAGAEEVAVVGEGGGTQGMMILKWASEIFEDIGASTVASYSVSILKWASQILIFFTSTLVPTL